MTRSQGATERPRQAGSAPFGIGAATGQYLGETSWTSIRSALTRTSSRSAWIQLPRTQMILHLRERFGVDFSFKDIFDASTVTALAARLESIEKAFHCRITELVRSANGNRARRRRWPSAGVHCAGAHATDRARAPWTTPVQPALRLSAARAAERLRTRAEPCRGRAPARLAAHGICLAGRDCLLLSSVRPQISKYPSSWKILQPRRLAEIPVPRRSC